MKPLQYLALFSILFIYSCSNQNDENGYPGNPCEEGEQGSYFTQTSPTGQDESYNLHFDDAKTIVQYVTGHPQGDYYHIYSTQSSPFMDFYTFAITAGSTSTLDQNWNTTAGSYLAINGSPYPQNNSIVLNTLLGGSQVGDAVKIEMNGTFPAEGNLEYTFTGGFCVTIDEVVNLAEYVYITDGTNLKIVNVSIPTSPNLSLSIPAPTSYYVNTFNSIAYVGYFDAVAPFVDFVNISNPPTSNIFGSIPKGANYGRVTDVVQVDNFTYISDEHKGFHKLHIANTDYSTVDIHDVMSMTKNGNNLSIIDFSTGLRKIDVTNANAPVITNISNLSNVDIASYPHTSGSFHSWLRTDATDYFLANINDKKLKKFQETNFGYNLVDEVAINGYATAFTIHGNYAFITTKASLLAPLQTSFDGITMINLSNMTVVDSQPLNNASGVVVKANYAYVTDANGLHIYDISTNLTLVHTYNDGFGNYIFFIKTITNMNTKITFILLLSILFISCDNNDDTVTATNIFTVATQIYQTPNCYIEFDTDTPQDHINLFLTDGRMYDNDLNENNSSGDYLFSLNTTNFVFLQLQFSNNPSLVTNGPTAGNTYIISSTDSTIGHNLLVDPLTPNFSSNGFDFGMGNENTGTFHTPGSGALTVTINAYTFNPSTLIGTIDLDYSFMNQNGTIITGHYDGNLGVILD